MFKKLPINYISAFIILTAVILWILSGVLTESSVENEIVAKKADEKIISVRASEFIAKDKTYFLTIRGRTEAEKKVMLKPKTTSTIISRIQKGIFVSKGETICSLDPENRVAKLDEAIANKNKSQLQYDAIKKLSDEGYRAENAVATAEAALKGAIARVKIAENDLDNVKVIAPFDGFVEDMYVEIGDLVNLEYLYNPLAEDLFGNSVVGQDIIFQLENTDSLFTGDYTAQENTLKWTPTIQEIGERKLRIIISDKYNHKSTHDYTVNVLLSPCEPADSIHQTTIIDRVIVEKTDTVYINTDKPQTKNTQDNLKWKPKGLGF